MIFVRDVDGNLVNLDGRDLVLWTQLLVAVKPTSNAVSILARGSDQYCRDALESLECWLARHATIIHPTFGVESAAEPDEPEGSFACDDGIAELPL